MTLAAQTAAAAGMTLTVSSGNDGYCDSMGWPACISGVISVGAVYDAGFGTVSFCVEPESCVSKYAFAGCPSGYRTDQATASDRVTGYSNVSSVLDLLAPSHNAYTTDIVGAGGYSSGSYVSNFGGTSAACPYVAGSIASLQQAALAIRGSYLTPQEVRTLLASTGDHLTDPKVAVAKPRVNLGRAIENLAACSQQTLTIYNDGIESLQVTSINTPSWLTLATSPPYVIQGGSSLQICVESDCGACAGMPLAGSVVITSNDPSSPGLSLAALLQCPCDHRADMDGDCDVDEDDLELFIACAAGPDVPYAPSIPTGCTLSLDGSNRLKADIDADDDVDVVDFAVLQRCWSGNGNPADPACVQ
jgi:hypothetical protein